MAIEIPLSIIKKFFEYSINFISKAIKKIKLKNKKTVGNIGFYTSLILSSHI